jgi:RNA polymerase sigma factor (sigma-70 family)
MAKPEPTALVRAVRHAVHGDGMNVSDRDLLRRFVEEDDQEAFATLVSRHTRMVFGVCRRALANHQDAEDACQATFLVLARRAKTQRWQPSVANWLYTTARKVARNAQVSQRRRSRREVRAGVCPVPCDLMISPLDRMTGRELQGVLDEELDRLPPRYREPLVLCYLEGLTRDEAAQRLGVSLATVKSQLERGRKRLHTALTARGCSLGTGLLGVAITSRTEASSPRLVASILNSVAGPPPAAVAELTRGLAVNGLMNKCVLAVLLLMGFTLLGIGWRSLTPAASQPPRATEQGAGERKADRKKSPGAEKAAAPKDQGSNIQVSGRVLSPEGKPVAGARLFVPRLRRAEPVTPEDVFLAQVGTTDEKGQFQVEIAPPKGRLRHYLMAQVPGFGVDWIELGKIDPGKEQTLHLEKEEPISGQVVSTEGKPIPGVSVSISAIYVPVEGKLDDYLAGWKKNIRDTLATPRKRLYLPPTPILGGTTTDREGRFTVRGAGAERIVHLQLAGGGIARSVPYVITRPGFDPKPYNEILLQKRYESLRILNRFLGLYPPKMTFVAEPGKTIEGVVNDGTTGKPVSGCMVSVLTGFGEAVVTTSDAEGKYRLEGVPKNPKGYQVSINPPRGSAYLRAPTRAKDSEGYGKVYLDIALEKGAIVTGRVIDKQTGKGLKAGVRFAPLPGNKFFGKKPAYSGYTSDRTMRGTDPDGTFRLVTIPGKSLVMAQVHTDLTFHGQYLNPYRRAVPDPEHKELFTYDADDDSWRITTAGNSLEFLSVEHAVKVIEIKEAGETRVDLFVDPGTTGTLAVQDPEGKPLTKAWVAGLTDAWPITYQLPEAQATLYALNPKKPRTLVIYHPERQLGGTVTVAGNEKGPVQARLQPLGTVKGRLLDLEGNPIPRATVSVNPVSEIGSELYRFASPASNPVRTDAQGRFTLPDVIPGMPFYLQIRKGNDFYRGKPRIGKHQVKPGETINLGDRKVEPIR